MSYGPAMTTRIFVLAAAAALTLTACGGASEAAAPPAPTTEVSVPLPTPIEEEPFQGPADSTAEFPGGISARLVSVEAGPAEEWVPREKPGHDGWVRITVELASTTSDPYPLDTNGVSGSLLYGVNRQAANAWMAEGGVEEMPQQVSPGTTVQVAFDYSLPASELGDLIFTFTPASMFEPEYSFTDVQSFTTD